MKISSHNNTLILTNSDGTVSVSLQLAEIDLLLKAFSIVSNIENLDIEFPDEITFSPILFKKVDKKTYNSDYEVILQRNDMSNSGWFGFCLEDIDNIYTKIDEQKNNIVSKNKHKPRVIPRIS